MTPNAVKQTLAFLVLLFGTVDSFPEWCDADTDRRLEQAIDTALAAIPPERSSEAGNLPLFPLTFDAYKVTGLNRLRRRGPVRTDCGNGSQVVNFSLEASEDPILCSFHWKDGGNLSLNMAAYGVWGTTQLRFVQGIPADGSGVARKILDEHEEPVASSFHVLLVALYIHDPSEGRNTSPRGFLRQMALAFIQDTWEDVFVPRFVHTLKEL